MVRHALERAGIDAVRTGVHQFRHALACQMLKQGASLSEIGELLRHRSPQTTAIYAKVDLNSLASLALSWLDDPLANEGQGVRRTAPQLGIQAAGRQEWLDPIRFVSRTESCDPHHCCGDEMGAPEQECARRRMGQAAQLRSRFCTPLELS
jgi:Phage integrase family